MTASGPVQGAPAKPSKAWAGLLALGVVAIVLIAICIAGVFITVGSRVKITPTPPARPVAPTFSRPAPVSPTVSGQPFPNGAQALRQPDR